MIRRLAILACVLGVSGCSGGRSAALIPPGAPAAPKVPPKSAQVHFNVTVPRASSGRLRSPRYVSVATQSASITVTPSGGPSSSPVVVNCTNVCSGQIAAPVGSDSFTIDLFDAPNGGGNLLSTGSLTQTIAIDQANTVNVTFNGVVKSLTVALSPASVATGVAATVAVTANALDAAGNVIVGPGGFADANGNALTITLTDSDTSGATKLSTTTLSAPATGITLSYNGTPIADPSVAATAPGVASATRTLTIGANGCPAPGSNADLYLGTNAGVSVYGLAASGNAAPLSTIALPSRAIAVDAQGTVYEANANGPNGTSVIEVLCSLPAPNATPKRTIAAPSGVVFNSLALDPSANLYAGDFLGSIFEYAPGAGASGPPSGNQAPTPTTRSLTGLGFYPQQIGVDASGNLYAGNGIDVSVYGPSAAGNAPAPSGHITRLAANLTGAGAVATDAAGDAFVLYGRDFRAKRCVTNFAISCDAVGVYASGGSGAPAHILTFDSQREVGPYAFGGSGTIAAIAADATGALYVLTNIQTGPTYIATVVAVYSPGHQDGDATPSRVINYPNNGGAASSIAVDGSGNVYFTNTVTNGGANVVVYGPTDTAPARTFGNGSLTKPAGIAVAPDGTAYVVQNTSGVVTIYAAGASGTQPPARTLNVAAAFPSAVVAGVAVDVNGVFYVNPVVAGHGASGLPLIATYPPGAAGSQAPARTMTDWFAGRDLVAGLSVDAAGNMYLVGSISNTVFVYPTSSSGTVSPSRRLWFVGASTRGTALTINNDSCSVLCIGASAYVDSRGNLYVSSFISNSILVYPPGAPAPSRSIIGPNTHLLYPQNMAVDASGNLFVTSLTGIDVFGPTANGDASPLRILNAQGSPAIGPGP